jgi:hypothetical protein
MIGFRKDALFIFISPCGGEAGPETSLSFPHGIAIDPDGKYLAEANYGTDSFLI